MKNKILLLSLGLLTVTSEKAADNEAPAIRARTMKDKLCCRRTQRENNEPIYYRVASWKEIGTCITLFTGLVGAAAALGMGIGYGECAGLNQNNGTANCDN